MQRLEVDASGRSILALGSHSLRFSGPGGSVPMDPDRARAATRPALQGPDRPREPSRSGPGCQPRSPAGAEDVD